MKPAIQFALIGLGGFVLLSTSFVTFAALSGVPLHEVAILKNFVAAPPVEDDGPKGGEKPRDTELTEDLASRLNPAGATDETKAGPTKTEERALEANIGVLGAFMLPAPFSSSELSDLQRSLRGANDDAKQRLERIELRERELREWEQALDQRNDELQELRRTIERRELELAAREAEVERDERARNSRDQESWNELARFFSEGEPEDLAKKLVLFEPKEAVRILRALDDARASALVNALPPDKYHAYLQAFRTAPK